MTGCFSPRPTQGGARNHRYRPVQQCCRVLCPNGHEAESLPIQLRETVVQHPNIVGLMPITIMRINQVLCRFEVSEGQINLTKGQSKQAMDQLVQRLAGIMGQFVKVDILKLSVSSPSYLH